MEMNPICERRHIYLMAGNFLKKTSMSHPNVAYGSLAVVGGIYFRDIETSMNATNVEADRI